MSGACAWVCCTIVPKVLTGKREYFGVAQIDRCPCRICTRTPHGRRGCLQQAARVPTVRTPWGAFPPRLPNLWASLWYCCSSIVSITPLRLLRFLYCLVIASSFSFRERSVGEGTRCKKWEKRGVRDGEKPDMRKTGSGHGRSHGSRPSLSSDGANGEDVDG
jgi:hypothetical protein